MMPTERRRGRTDTPDRLLAAAPPIVLPVEPSWPRPFWSVIVPTVDREEYLRETLQSVLRQAPGPDEMQIEVIDNGSTAVDVQALVREVGQGRVEYYRQRPAVSISENWTTCIQRARGRWVHIMPDDDIVEPGFYSAYREFIEDQPDVVLVACQARLIDARGRLGRLRFNPPGVERTGVLENGHRQLVACDWIATPSAVAKREAYERVGGFRPFAHVIDWDMWLRLADVGPVGYIHEPLIRNRDHAGSGSMSSFRSGRHIAEIAAVIAYAVERLPTEERARVRRAASAEYAGYADYMSYVLAAQGYRQAAVHHALWAWRLHPSPLRTAVVLHRLLELSRASASVPKRLKRVLWQLLAAVSEESRR